MNENYLEHHGILGQKWGVRRYQNSDGTLTEAGKKQREKYINKVNSMYDHSNKWTNRKIEKLNEKQKTAKANVMQEMVKRNETARKSKIKSVQKMNYTEFKKASKHDLADTLIGGQKWMNDNKSMLSNPISRFSEYHTQRGMRWMSNFTFNSTLARMSPSEGYEYLRRKNITVSSQSNSTNTHYM